MGIFGGPTNEAMGLGLRVPSTAARPDPATRMGLGAMQDTRADTAVSGRPVPSGAPGRLEALLAAPPLPAPSATARPPATVYFNQATNEMFAGDRAFKADDATSAFQAAQQPGNTTRPQGQGWAALPEGSFNDYIASFSERRGTGELLGRGIKNVAYGLGTLPGTVASLAGFEETGAALRAPVESLLGESENEQFRSALIAENSSLWEQALDASIESIPMLIGSLAGGVGAASWASRAGMAAQSVNRAAMVGAAGANFPTHLAGMYDSAVRNGADLTSLQTKTEIFAGALASSALETLGIESRLLTPVAKGVFEQAAKNVVTRRLTSGLAVGLTEATTEVLQTAIESMWFDPVVRDSLSVLDLKTLARHTGENYLEPFAVAGLAGGILGGAIGVAVPGQVFNRPREEKQPVPTDKPVDLTDAGAKQAAEKEAPLGAMQGPRLEDYMQGPLREIQGPLREAQGPLREAQGPLREAQGPLREAQGPLREAQGPLREMQGPLREAQGPAPLGPMQGPAPLGVVQGPPAPITLRRANERQATLAARNAEFDAGQTMDVARGAMARGLARTGRQAAAARQGGGLDATQEGEVALAAAGRGLQRTDRQAELAARGRAADVAVGEQVATVATPADRLYYQNLMDAETRVEAANRALVQAQAAGNRVQQQQAGLEYNRAAAELAKLRARVEDVAAGETPVRTPVRAPTQVPLREAQGPLREMQGPLREMQGPLREVQGPLREAQGPLRETQGPKPLTKTQKAAATKAAKAAAAEAQSTAVVERRREAYPDGNTAVEYGIGDAGFATVQIAPDGTAHLMNIQIGDADSTTRGKGLGTQAYTEIGQKLAAEGVRLQSTQWSKHNTAISPAALRIWEKLTAAKLAHQIGKERGKVLDRTTGQEEVRDVPIYEFGPKPTGGKEATLKAKTTRAPDATPPKGKKPGTKEAGLKPKGPAGQATPTPAPAPAPEVQTPREVWGEVFEDFGDGDGYDALPPAAQRKWDQLVARNAVWDVTDEGANLSAAAERFAPLPVSEVTTTFRTRADLKARIDSGLDTFVYRGVRQAAPDEDASGNEEAGYFWTPSYAVAEGYAASYFGGENIGTVFVMRVPASVLAKAQQSTTEVPLEGLTDIVALEQRLLADEGIEFVIPPALHGQRVEIGLGLSPRALAAVVTYRSGANPVKAPRPKPKPVVTEPEPAPEVQTPAETPAETPEEPTRVTKATSGLDFDYYVVELSDGKAVEVRIKDKSWVFRSDESPIEGDKLTRKTVGAAVAKMAGEGKLPGATSVFAEPKLKAKRQTVKDEQAVLDQETAEELAGMEKDLGKTADPMKDERLQAAKDLLTIINDTDIVLDIRERAQKILDSAVTPEQKAVAEAALAAELVTERGTKETAKQVDMPKPVADLIALIRAYNSGAGGAFSQGARFSTLAGVVAKDHPNALYDGRPLKAYFNEGNFRPTFGTVDGVRRIVPAPVAGAPASGVNALADFNTLVGATGYDGKPATPMATGRVQLLVRNFASKLARPPKMTVARNQADLKAKNPALYARAKAARGTGDFDTADAMGYSFGDGEVIVFSDRIATEQQLNFVLAHETLGHYGLRAIMPASKFEGVMDAVYNSNSLIKANVDMTVAVRGMGRAEATEEYLADYAAVLDMSVLRRVAAAMKNGLNALGFKFSDDMVRHLVRTARRYVRNGKRDNMFTASGVFRDIHDIESGADSLATGRFKEGFRSDNLRTDLLVYDVFGGPPRSVEQATAAIKEASSQLSARTEKFVNKFFSLTMFRAQENAGLSALVRIIMRSGEIAAAVRNRADEIMRFALNREVRILGVRVMGGITETEQIAAGYLMYTQQDSVRGKVDAKVEATLAKLREAKKPTRMFSIIDGEVQDNPDAIEAYKAAGRLSLPEAKAILAADSRYKGIADKLDKDHPTWKAYEEGREAFELETEFVKAQYKALIEDRGNAEMSMLDMLADPGPGKEKELLPQERAMFRTWTELYYALYAGGAVTVEDNLIATETGRGEAERFSKAVNEVILAKGFDTKKEAAVRKFFTGKRVDDFIGQLVDFRQRITRTTENEFAAQNAVAEFAAAEMSFTSAETSARKMLVQGYTPIVRKQQGFQIRVNAFDAETGAFVQMDTEHKGLAVYRTAGSVEEVTTLANQMNGQFADTENIPEGATDVEIATVDGKPVRTYKMKVRGKGEIDFKERRVIIRAEASAAVTGVTTPLNLNINEFLRGLRQYGLNVTPTKLEQIVIDMSAQDAKARKRLEQTGNPGYQVEGGVTALEAIAQHVDGRASLISKIQMRPLIDRLMNIKLSESQKLWFGDKQKLNALKKAYDAAEADPNANEAARFLAKAEYTDYAAKMKNTIATKNGVEVNLGNKYLSEAQDLMAFVNGNKDVNESDWGSGPVASWFRRWISSVQLGGTLAQPIMNNVGPFTNFLPWLGSFNAKNGFGGGAGFKNAYAQYLRAMSDVGSSGGMSFSKQAVEMHTAKYWDEVETGLREHPGVTKFEAEFIANETRNGVLTPAQANSLLGHSRNYTTNPAVRQALDKWMFFYISSEQATRRAAALAAFRVEVTRQLDAKGLKIENLTDAQRRTIYAKASTFATDGVRVTLGEYGVVNRPAAWRSGFQSFLYMYRVWQTTSIQTFNRLDARGKAAFLIPLLALSGLAGLPFAEDLEDVLDTLMQRLGMTTGSVRLEAARLIDEVMPGMSPYILNGGLTKVIGADVAGRFSMGDFVPGTAALLPGQDPFQTFKEVVGPAWGFLEGTLKGSSQLVAAPFSETATVVDAMREGPVTLLRALGDTMAYASTGAVIDKRGYVIEDDLTTTMLAIRILGFTPGSVAAQYEVIRLAKRETNYQKQVVAKFRTQLLKAEMRGDRVTAASIRRSVKEWNAVEKGTLLEIRDFEKNYQRLKKQALMPAKQRFMQSAGKANQDAIELIDQLASYD